MRALLLATHTLSRSIPRLTADCAAFLSDDSESAAAAAADALPDYVAAACRSSRERYASACSCLSGATTSGVAVVTASSGAAEVATTSLGAAEVVATSS
jgi:hypothetical protein